MRRGAVRKGTLPALMRRICTDEHLVLRFRVFTFPCVYVAKLQHPAGDVRIMQNYAELATGKALIINEKKIR